MKLCELSLLCELGTVSLKHLATTWLWTLKLNLKWLISSTVISVSIKLRTQTLVNDKPL